MSRFIAHGDKGWVSEPLDHSFLDMIFSGDFKSLSDHRNVFPLAPSRSSYLVSIEETQLALQLGTSSDTFVSVPIIDSVKS